MIRYGLSDILDIFTKGFKEVFGSFHFRFEAEINKVKKLRNFLSLELVESDENGYIKAKTTGIIFDETTQQNLLDFTGIQKREELIGGKLLFHGRGNFHKDYGFSIIIDGISPEYIIGKMQTNKEKIKEQLTKEGILANNIYTSIGFPPFSIAVISGAESEGLNDFTKILSESGFIFHLLNYESAVHGNNAKEQILEVLQKVKKDSENHKIDLIAIIRGGGESFGMSRGNDINIAKEICHSSIPVMTAVGHTKDKTILDEISKYSPKTPSDAAHLLLNIAENYKDHIDGIFQEINQAIRTIKQNYAENIDKYYTEIKKNINTHKNILSQNLENLKEKIDSFSPEKAVKKGYGILLDSNGNYISRKALEDFKPEDTVYLKVYNKKLKMKIKEVENI